MSHEDHTVYEFQNACLILTVHKNNHHVRKAKNKNKNQDHFKSTKEFEPQPSFNDFSNVAISH